METASEQMIYELRERMVRMEGKIDQINGSVSRNRQRTLDNEARIDKLDSRFRIVVAFVFGLAAAVNHSLIIELLKRFL